MCFKKLENRERPGLLLLLDPPPEPPNPAPPPPTTPRPWSKLPLPFVKHLLRRLQIPDYIRFSSVCNAWHVYKKRAQTLPSQRLPWLLLPRHIDEPSVTFYSLSEDCLYHIPIPHIIGSECVSAVRGWLLFEPNKSAGSSSNQTSPSDSPGSSSPAIPSRFIVNPLLDILHELPNSSLHPQIKSAAAIFVSPSPDHRPVFWVFFFGWGSIFFWNPVEKLIFTKEIDLSNEYWVGILDMTAEGDIFYYISDNLDLFEYHHSSSSTNSLILNSPDDSLPQPSPENNHFLMVARVGEEMKILMAVVVYELEVSIEKVDHSLDSETAKGVKWVELYSQLGGGWARVEVAEFGDQVLFLSYRASSFCVTAAESGGRGSRVYLVPDQERADSISRAQGVEELMWVEIDLVTCGVTYKEKKNIKSAKMPRIQGRPLFFFSPLFPSPQEPEKPRIHRRLFAEPREQPPPPPTTRPWSKLPLPFVKQLLRRLRIPDYIRFSSVCHAWHISKKRAQTPPAPHFPLILLPREIHEPIITYYSLSDERNYRFSVSYISGYKCVASMKGWLLFEEITIVHSCLRRFLLNPLSGKQHDLPNFPVTGFVLPKVNAAAIMVPSSPADEGIRIFIATGKVIFVYDLVSSVQSKVQLNFDALDIVATTNNVYIVKKNLDLVEFDPRTNVTTDLVLDVPQGELPWPSKETDHFLVFTQACLEGLDILMVVVFYSIVCDGKPVAVDRLELYVPLDGAWVRMPPDVLGDLVLFLGFGGSSISITAVEAGVRARMAYMVLEQERLKSLSNEVGRDLKCVVFDLESGVVTYK